VSEGVENVRPCFRKYHFVQVSRERSELSKQS
jgi:hypothetical protein